jgi:hypothetical protein
VSCVAGLEASFIASQISEHAGGSDNTARKTPKTEIGGQGC